MTVLIRPMDPLPSILKTHTLNFQAVRTYVESRCSWLGPGWDLWPQSIPFSCEATALASDLVFAPQLKADPAPCPPQSLGWGTGMVISLESQQL